jgi:hypothetical protein
MVTKKILLAAAAAALGMLLVISRTISTGDGITGDLYFGIGATLMVLGIGNLIAFYVEKAVETPEIRKMSLREEKDERNIRVREKAGWNAGRIMLYILCFVALASAFTGAELYITGLFAALVMTESLLTVGFLAYYDKRM